ncbi:type II secretion system protein M, partial [Escherichia coli]
MIKSWWAEKSTSEKQIVAALAVLSLGVFCWLAVIKPIDTYIEEHQSHAQKIKKDIKWMQDQASTHGLLGHPALTQPIKNILLEEAKRENLTITLENGPDNTVCYLCRSEPAGDVFEGSCDRVNCQSIVR